MIVWLLAGRMKVPLTRPVASAIKLPVTVLRGMVRPLIRIERETCSLGEKPPALKAIGWPRAAVLGVRMNCVVDGVAKTVGVLVGGVPVTVAVGVSLMLPVTWKFAGPIVCKLTAT
jgi:hypothetical protein